ncbi:TraX family protein [Microcoleus sp. F10-D1]|uniref:TraX family protein n=3 Tax=Microcoleus TaxID=44471 RepID=UPI002FD43101
MSQNQIKWLATILMVIDHIGFLLEIEPMRVVGRLSFPLFAWVLAQNWKRREPNSSAKPLINRLVLFGIISQVPHLLLFNNLQLNILISLAVAIITFVQIHKSDRKILVLTAGLITAQVLGVSYGWYAVACPLLMVNLKGKGDRMWWISWSITNIIYATSASSLIQLFAVLTPVILSWHNPAKDRKPTAIEKKFFYYFYPVHLAGLAALRAIL